MFLFLLMQKPRGQTAALDVPQIKARAMATPGAPLPENVEISSEEEQEETEEEREKRVEEEENPAYVTPGDSEGEEEEEEEDE